MKIKNQKHKKMKKLMLVSAISTALGCPSIFAQEFGTSDEAESDVEIIKVTAQKRSERIIDVPISMSAFSSEAIEQTGVQELRDLAEFIPNVTMTTGTDFHSRILIRGIGAQARNIGFDARVGVYLDGVYLGQAPSQNLELVDLERVEVLRGPQGTLFGKNTVAGAMNLISKKPIDETEAELTVNLSNFNGFESRFDVNLPFTDELAGKFSFVSRKRDGFIDNVWQQEHVPTEMVIGSNPQTGELQSAPIAGVIFFQFNPIFVANGLPPHPTNGIGPTRAPEPLAMNDQDVNSWRAQLNYRPNDDLEINFALDGLDSDRLGILGVNVTDSFGSTVEQNAPALDQVSWSRPGEEVRDILGGSIITDYSLENDFFLKSITAYRSSEIHIIENLDYSAIDFSTLDFTDTYDQFTQEFQFISPDNNDFKYVVGLYYLHEEADTDRNIILGNGSFYFSDFENGSITYPGQSIFSRGTLETESTAIFLNGSYQLAPAWELGFGLRYSVEDKAVDWTLDGTNSGIFAIASGIKQEDRTDTDLSPMVSLSYALNRNSNLYASYSTGFKAGGYNMDFVDASAFEAGLEFDKETADSFEIGLKTILLDGDLTLSTALFHTEFQDYQVPQFFVSDGVNGIETTSVRIENAAEVETQGLEVEASYALTENVSVTAALGLLDATFIDFPNGMRLRDPITGVAGSASNAAGNRIPGASEQTASIGVQYYKTIDSLDADLLMRLDVNYIGDFYTTIENVQSRGLNGSNPMTLTLDPDNFGRLDSVPFGYVDDYTLVNGRIGLISNSEIWEIYLWGRNLTNEDQYTDTVRGFFGALTVTPQVPRTYGIEFTLNF